MRASKSPLGSFRRVVAGGAIVGLVLAGYFFLPIAKDETSYRAPRPLVSMMHAVPASWAVADRAVGATEAETSSAESMLRYDDAFVRTYTRGSTQVMIYLAYWKPGRMDPRLILIHTPDVCWIVNGAKMVNRVDQFALPETHVGILYPAFFRTFDWSGEKTQVIFWHIFGGKLSGFSPEDGDDEGLGTHKSAVNLMVQTLKTNGFGAVRHDQLFIRISTNGTIDDLVKSDLWPALVDSLAPTGIVAKGPS